MVPSLQPSETSPSLPPACQRVGGMCGNLPTYWVMLSCLLGIAGQKTGGSLAAGPSVPRSASAHPPADHNPQRGWGWFSGPSWLVGLVAKSCLTLADPMDCSLPGSSVHGDSPGKNTGVGCHFLLQYIFPIQESNPGLLHCRQTLYRLSYEGSPSGPSGSPHQTLHLARLPPPPWTVSSHEPFRLIPGSSWPRYDPPQAGDSMSG